MTSPPTGLKLENSTHIAQRASALSARYASERNKAAWLALYADDALIQDPVGVSPLDPTGHGHRGREALVRFWDMIIGPGNMTYRIPRVVPRARMSARTCGPSPTACRTAAKSRLTW